MEQVGLVANFYFYFIFILLLQYKSAGADIVAVLNADMIAYRAANENPQVAFVSRSSTPSLNTLLSNVCFSSLRPSFFSPSFIFVSFHLLLVSKLQLMFHIRSPKRTSVALLLVPPPLAAQVKMREEKKREKKESREGKKKRRLRNRTEEK